LLRQAWSRSLDAWDDAVRVEGFSCCRYRSGRIKPGFSSAYWRTRRRERRYMSWPTKDSRKRSDTILRLKRQAARNQKEKEDKKGSTSCMCELIVCYRPSVFNHCEEVTIDEDDPSMESRQGGAKAVRLTSRRHRVLPTDTRGHPQLNLVQCLTCRRRWQSFSQP
jgi:hypothetical protein